jgi:hypothetical protein
MAGRKDKNIVDYFPHMCEHGKTMFIIEQKHGNNGYAVWFKTLEMLGRSENHYIDCRNIADWEFLQAKMQLMSAELTDIYNTLSNLGAIHKELWENNNVIWSNNFIKNIQDAYKRRNNKCMHFIDLCIHLSIKCKHKYDSNGNIVSKKTQSRVKESKEDESIGEEIISLSGNHLFKNSPYFNKQTLWDALDEKYKKYDIGYYYEQMVNYSEQGHMYKNWLATLRSWINRDIKEGNAKAVPKKNQNVHTSKAQDLFKSLKS